MKLTLGQALELAKTLTPITALECRDNVAAVYCRHHPEPPLLPSADHIRSTDQVAVFKSAVLVFSIMAKHNPDSSSCFNESSAEICGDGLIEALGLSFSYAPQVEISVAFAIKFKVCCVDHV